MSSAGATGTAERPAPAKQRPNAFIGHEPVTGRLEVLRALSRKRPGKPAANENRYCETIAFLADHAYPAAHLSRASRLAIRNGTTGASELLANGLITEDAYYRTLAEHAGLTFIPPEDIAETLNGDKRPVDETLNSATAWCRLTDGTVRPVAAPLPDSPVITEKLVARQNGRDTRVALTIPSVLRKAAIARVRDTLGEDAAFRLANEMPAASAKHGASAWHGFALAVVLSTAATGLIVAPATAFVAVHVLASLFFLANIALRLAATAGFRRMDPVPLAEFENSERPVYSVVVALYREATVAADLVASLKSLNWPRSKLEIKLVCEEDDRRTLAVLESQKLDGRFEIVRVPRLGPRTKPKALNYALPLCSGTFVTLYDAEDRPHPDQIEEAWQTFRRSQSRVAALQAPLVIANPRRNWIAGLFHVEYAAQFRGLLPFLTRHGLPVPLGGTSTHFRRAALEHCGAWDPHNVTEDADLGFRLWRAGFRIATISRPTLEDAPADASVWLRQRTRWIKGWIQTWIVNTRLGALRPQRMPLAGMLTLHALLAGTVICSLFFPLTLFLIAGVAAWGALTGEIPLTFEWLAAIEWANILLAFGVHAALGLRAVDRPERWRTVRVVPMLPVYWLLMSIAGWRAFVQYFRNPFLWEKTPHAPHDPNGVKHRI